MLSAVVNVEGYPSASKIDIPLVLLGDIQRVNHFIGRVRDLFKNDEAASEHSQFAFMKLPR